MSTSSGSSIPRRSQRLEEARVGAHRPLEALELVEAERRLDPRDRLDRGRLAALEVDDQADDAALLGLVDEQLGAAAALSSPRAGSAVEAATKRVRGPISSASRATATQASTSAAESGSSGWAAMRGGSALLI